MAEYELEARFLYEIYAHGGCRKAAYTSICACGPNGAVLHYGHAGAPNDRVLRGSDMALLDMGADYHGYVSGARRRAPEPCRNALTHTLALPVPCPPHHQTSRVLSRCPEPSRPTNGGCTRGSSTRSARS